ncbi:cytochrome P450 family protein [Paraburkholderia phenoliruptrix]|uniref:cytochrome P450 family protein n=1 Tax=Paraburkholderia phenoliruptrix TaxID=252970 RepID=UPI001C6E5B4E|nr:cytochrome P450 [Paraburkholderia phenoliruptrix]MBW9107419.1 cytochrome P450 [Paraburkholderia phenoliruptrix]MBW9128159.1 cytochrome P450 [Paraburkholderia ginsengiterrae]
MKISNDSRGEIIDLPPLPTMLDPFPEYAKLAQRGAVVRVRNPVGTEIYLITRWAEAIEALNNPLVAKGSEHLQKALAAQRLSGPSAGTPIAGSLAGNLLNTDPPDHTRLRSLVMLAFTPRRLEQLRATVELLVDRLIDQMRGGSEADLIADFAYPIGITTICAMLGVPEGDRSDFRQWAEWAMTPGHKEQERCMELLRNYLATLIESKRSALEEGANPDAQPDLLSAMIAARNASNALTMEELQSMSYLLLIAGHETTVGLIGNALLHLMLNPGQQELLAQDPTLIKNAIEETLRYDGSVPYTTFRATTADVKIGDTIIPDGSFVQVVLPALNRDPAKFEDPNVFDIRRKIKQHMAFGHGTHFCLGSHLARLEAQTAVGRFMQVFPNVELNCNPEDIPWLGTVIRGARSLPVRLNGKASKES